jgi:hypothetical protein
MSLSPLQLAKMKAAIAEAKKTQYSGLFSIGAKKRIGRAIDLLIQIAKPTYGLNEVTGRKQKHTLSFITLTIHNARLLTAKTGYDLVMKHFLQWLRRTKKATSYVWKAEFQNNGQLHYHITTPAWIHYQEIKDKWNNLLRSAGLLDTYQEKFGHWNANSTDIHEVRNIDNLAGYLKKEFCKQIQNQQTEGKLWDCSINLKDNKYFALEYDLKLLTKVYQDLKAGKLKRIELDQCTIYKATTRKNVQNVLDLSQIQQYKDYLNHIINYQRIDNKKPKS